MRLANGTRVMIEGYEHYEGDEEDPNGRVGAIVGYAGYYYVRLPIKCTTTDSYTWCFAYKNLKVLLESA
jgi:hypothetical protein